MLSIEYIHKRVRLFQIELSLIVFARLAVLIFLWQLFSMQRFFK